MTLSILIWLPLAVSLIGALLIPARLARVVAVIGSIDIVLGEIDR